MDTIVEAQHEWMPRIDKNGSDDKIIHEWKTKIRAKRRRRRRSKK